MHCQKLMSRIIFFGVLVTLLAGCNSSNPLWTIFPEHRAEQLEIGSWLASDTELRGYWTPAEEDILNLEGKLDPFLRQNAESFNRQPPIWEQLNSYKRQYVGVEINEKQVIYGNFFCRDAGTDWKKDWVFVLDGGDCYFQLLFDPESEAFIELTVNGEA